MEKAKYLMRHARLFSVALLASGFLLSAERETLAEDTVSYGGRGGGPFRSECRPSDALIGINLRSGTALDAVVSICIPLNAQRTEWAGQAYEPTQYWGGGGGSYQKIACHPGDVVRQLRVVRGPWGDLTVVKHIAIQCADLGSDYTYEVAQVNPRGSTSGSRWLNCGRRSIATGLHGNSGALIDRMGLSCRPR